MYMYIKMKDRSEKITNWSPHDLWLKYNYIYSDDVEYNFFVENKVYIFQYVKTFDQLRAFICLM